MDPAKWPVEKMNPEVKGGRGPLLAASILHGAGALILGNSVSDADPVAVREAFRTDATINICVGVIFIGIWMWAKSAPLKASITGLALFLIVRLTTAIMSPSSLVIGLLINSVILIFLVRSVIAARAARAWEKIEGAR